MRREKITVSRTQLENERRRSAAEALSLQLPPGVRRLVPFKTACRYGSWGKDRAYELIRDGKIKAYKDGRKTLVDLDSIDAYRAHLPQLRTGTNV